MDQVERAGHARQRWWAVSIAGVVTLAALSACGGGGGDEDRADDSASSRRTTTTLSGDATTTSTADPTASTAGPATTAPPATGGPGGVAAEIGVDRAFTGEGGEAFCGEVSAVQTALESSEPGAVDEAAVTAQLAALSPPAEIAADWSAMITVQQQLASADGADPLAGIDQAQLDAYGLSTAVVAAYLGDVCQIEFLG